jgi:hypothetical protein
MAALLTRQYPEEVAKLDEVEFRQGIITQTKKAGIYGLTIEQPAGMFVVCAWVLGVGFDEEIPAVGEMLRRQDLSQEEKAQWLETFLITLVEVHEQSQEEL